MDFQALLTQLLPVLGQVGVTKLSEQLRDLSSSAGAPWQKLVLNLFAEAVEAHGPQGVELARKAMDDLLAGKPPKIDWANPRTASDIVAMLQNAEANERSAARDFFVKVGNVFGQILAGVVKSFAASM